MTEYTITINGYKSAFAQSAVKTIAEGAFPNAESVEVSEQE